jgi:NDP-sugar pyrophosphorylase family protein
MLSSIKAMIFAAGLGTRLKPFTDNHPKALAVVNGKTLLERTLIYLKGFGVKEVVINVHHFAEQIESYLSLHRDEEMNIVLSHEVNGPYETGGGLVFAAEKLKGDGNPFVVMNVDMLTNLDLLGMYEYHQKISPLATLAVTKRESSRQFLFNDEMRLVGWRNNKTGEYKWVNLPIDEFIPLSFSGIHVIDPAIFEYMPASGTFSITDTYLKLAKEQLIIGYDHTGDVILDVGKPEAILQAEAIFE